MKNQKGITLIALVITIIVLLILAGITIALLTGDNGLITKSQKAASDTAVAEAKEKATVAVAAAYADYMEAKYTNSTGAVPQTAFTATTYVTGLSNVSGAYEVSAGIITITPKKADGKEVKGEIQDNGSITWTEATPTAQTTNP